VIWRGLLIGEDELEAKKSSVLWLKKGSKCTKFFQRMANSNRRNNSIELLVNGLAQFLLVKLRLGTTLCISIMICLLNSLIGGPNLMALIFIPLMRLLLG
jgi:hypothetical protein